MKPKPKPNIVEIANKGQEKWLRDLAKILKGIAKTIYNPDSRSQP